MNSGYDILPCVTVSVLPSTCTFSIGIVYGSAWNLHSCQLLKGRNNSTCSGV